MEIPETLNEVGAFASSLVTRPGMTPEDVIKVGAALLVAAQMIFESIGGAELAASQFYAFADRCAAPHK